MENHMSFYDNYSIEQLELLRSHLQKRFEYRNKANNMGVVFDILHKCDLQCRGCGTNAVFTNENTVKVLSPSIADLEKAFIKINKYAQQKGVFAFINIGGGEPFLRHDISNVLKLASEIFGAQYVGVDTNGTLEKSADLILEICKYVSYIGISINGLKNYHNWWSGNNRIDAYERSLSTVKELCRYETLRQKIEVTSIATKKNLDDIPKLIELLEEIEVQNYSVHRAIPVGRMRYQTKIIPDAKEYLDLLISMLEVSKNKRIKIHLHHSIESIHATLIMGLKTYVPDKVGNPDAGSSLGIEPSGTLVFDPWCTTGIWKSLSGGNLFNDDVDLNVCIDDERGSIFDLLKIYTAPHLRCNGCEKECSGGSRVVAAAEILNKIDAKELTDSHILSAMTNVDPACPLYFLRDPLIK